MQRPNVRLVAILELEAVALSGIGQTCDGLAVAAGDDVLVIGDEESGPYVAGVGPWVRRADWNHESKIMTGDWWIVEEGATQEGSR